MRKLKLVLISIVIFLIVLWFGGNLGLYLYLKYRIITPERVRVLNELPKQLVLDGSKLDSDSICFAEAKLKFPFYRNDISRISPSIYIGSLIRYQSVFLAIALGKGHPAKAVTISIDNTPKLRLPERDKSLNEWFWNLMAGDFNRKSLIEAKRRNLNASPDDYSWWNLYHNLKLTVYLTLKSMAYPLEGITYFDVNTPHLNGFLLERKRTLRWKAIYTFEFEHNANHYSITYFDGTDEGDSAFEFMKNLVASIDVADREECYIEMETEYKNKADSNYPEDLLLLSMISIEGPTVENLTKLKQLMEEKKYGRETISRLDDQIRILEESN